MLITREITLVGVRTEKKRTVESGAKQRSSYHCVTNNNPNPANYRITAAVVVTLQRTRKLFFRTKPERKEQREISKACEGIFDAGR